jgi:cardiolipin synthase (CMP-forming)
MFSPLSMALATEMRQANPFNLPNVLTYGRVVAVPVVVACMFWPEEFWMRWAAFAVFTVAGITDFFDGYLARVWSQQSTLGRMLDPIADKLLVAATLLMLVADRTIQRWDIWAAIVILSREILVSGLREYLAELRVSVPVSTVAKWKTTLQLIAIGFLVVGPAGESILPGTVLIGEILLWISAILTLYTGYDYFRAGIHHIVDHGA